MTTLGIPDPTDRTLQSLDQSVTNLQELIDHKLLANGSLAQEKLDSIRREIELREAYRMESNAQAEAHRLELKADGEKTLSTATIARDAAVQAALAASDHLRDQQTAAFQLATTKAEVTSKEQAQQQGETFSAAIAGLTMGLSDMKAALGELRAEARGNKESTTTTRAWTALAVTVIGLVIAYVSNFVLGG